MTLSASQRDEVTGRITDIILGNEDPTLTRSDIEAELGSKVSYVRTQHAEEVKRLIDELCYDFDIILAGDDNDEDEEAAGDVAGDKAPQAKDGQHGNVVKQYDNFYSPENNEFYASQQYQILDVDEEEIRVLSLLPGSGDDPIVCELLDNMPMSSIAGKYIALSYCAGNHLDTSKILVNDIPFNVFAGLGQALRRIRRTDEFLKGRPHLVWVDQICINQSDLAERSAQVVRMREIYHNSGRVMVWLGGEGDKDSMNFLKNHYDNVKLLLDGINEDIEKPKENEEDDESPGDKSGKGEKGEKSPRKKGVSREPSDSPEAITEYITSILAADFMDHIENEDFVEGWKSLANIASSQWWCRAWICQEIVVARSATIMCGPTAMDWKEFCTVWPVMRKAARNFMQAILDNPKLVEGPLLSMLKECGLEQFVRIDFILKTQLAWHKNEGRGIRPLLEASRTCQVTDPRDRIYAFLGLADPDYMIEPDYKASNTLADVFCDTCRRTILFEQSLDMLCHAQENKRSLNDDLPSWVPDWSVDRDRVLLQDYDVDFKASGGFKSAAEFVKDSNGLACRILRVQCLFLDKLANSNTLGKAGNPDERLDITREEWTSILERSAGKLTNKNAHAFVDTLWRGAGDDLQSQHEEDEDTTGQTKDLNTTIKNRRKQLLEESLSGNWRYFISPKGHMGLAHFRAQKSDQICCLLGASVPFVLRKQGNHYVLIGEAYVHGFMNGEAIEMMKKEQVKVRTIDLW